MRRLDALFDRLRDAGEHPCVDDGERASTYADLLRAVHLWSRRIAALGIRGGQVVGLQADHSLDAIALLLAVVSRGAVAALLPVGRAVSESLADCRARHLLRVDTNGRWDHEGRSAEDRDVPVLDRLRDTREGGIVLFTSGSTGRPKAALHSVKRFMCKFERRGRPRRTLAFLLFDHVAGLDTVFHTLSAGGTLVLTRRRDATSILALVERARVQVLPVSPSFLRLMCAAGAEEQRDLSSLEIVTYGSEPMDQATLTRLNERLPGVRIVQRYGTTETGSPRTTSRANDSLWVRLEDGPGLESQVRDGVLWIRSEHAILGYINSDSPGPVDADGWYCTGDVVDVDGPWIRFRGRMTDAINVGGEKVSPADVERVILEVDWVDDAVVSGERDPLLGQVVIARVAAPRARSPEEARREIRRHCATRLPRYAVPVRVELVTGSLVGERQKRVRREIA